jgi:uroporphyrinogen-III synthase
MILGRKLNPGGHIPRIAAVGPATAEAARQAGLPTDFVANTHNGVALANELGDTLRERSVFLPRSDRANPDLPEALRRNGARVTEVIAYRTLPANNPDQEQIKRIVGGEADAILFFSPSAVQNLAELVGGERLRTLGTKPVCVAVGPVTQRALREAGVQSILIAADATTSAVIETLEEHFTGKEKKSHAGVERG